MAPSQIAFNVRKVERILILLPSVAIFITALYSSVVIGFFQSAFISSKILEKSIRIYYKITAFYRNNY